MAKKAEKLARTDIFTSKIAEFDAKSDKNARNLGLVLKLIYTCQTD